MHLKIDDAVEDFNRIYADQPQRGSELAGQLVSRFIAILQEESELPVLEEGASIRTQLAEQLLTNYVRYCRGKLEKEFCDKLFGVWITLWQGYFPWYNEVSRCVKGVFCFFVFA